MGAVPPGVAASSGPVYQGPPPMGPPPDSNPAGRTGWILAGVAVVVAIGAIATAAFLIGNSRDDSAHSDGAVTTTTTPVAPTSIVASTTLPAPAPTAPPPIGDVRQQPAGLFCRDLRAKGFSYSGAVDYWRLHGQPDSMDVDKNGIPCETVYPASDVVAYWGTQGRTVTVGGDPSVYPGGLLCRDLAARGASTAEALDYYLIWGRPSRMDEDGNGIPCETVYADADAVWESGAF